MEQVARITQMEQILDEVTEAVSALSEMLEQYSNLQGKLRELAAYYGSEQWRRDYDDDSTGKLPKDLKRGVLSEDAVYNLLAERTELMRQMEKLIETEMSRR